MSGPVSWLFMEMDQLHQRIPKTFLRSFKWITVLLQVRKQSSFVNILSYCQIFMAVVQNFRLLVILTFLFY